MARAKSSGTERTKVVAPSRIKDRELIERRRAQIINAARTVFRKKGFHRSTVRDIGLVANLTQGSLYNYIHAKEDILVLICDEFVTKIQEFIRDVSIRYETPQERLDVAIRGYVEIMDQHQDDVLLMYHESHSLPRAALHSILNRVHDSIDDFATILRLGSAAAKLPVANARLTANILTFLPTILALRRWDLQRCANRTEAKHELVAFMMRGLGK